MLIISLLSVSASEPRCRQIQKKRIQNKHSPKFPLKQNHTGMPHPMPPRHTLRSASDCSNFMPQRAAIELITPGWVQVQTGLCARTTTTRLPTPNSKQPTRKQLNPNIVSTAVWKGNQHQYCNRTLNACSELLVRKTVMALEIPFAITTSHSKHTATTKPVSHLKVPLLEATTKSVSHLKNQYRCHQSSTDKKKTKTTTTKRAENRTMIPPENWTTFHPNGPSPLPPTRGSLIQRIRSKHCLRRGPDIPS